MPRLMLIRTRCYPDPIPTWDAWIEGHAEFETGIGSTQTAAVESLMDHINSYRLRESLRKSLEQVTA